METNLTVLDNSSVGFARAEVDCQVATAKHYPRNVAKCLRDAKEIIGSDIEIAKSCIYALPIGQNIQKGASVRLAEIMAYAWGNIRCESRILENDGNAVVVASTAWDLEKETIFTMPVRRQIQKSKYAKSNDKPNDFLVNNAINAAISIAMRNAIYRVIPKSIVNMAYQYATQVAIGDVKSIYETASKAISWFNKAGIPTARILSYFEINSVDDIASDHIETMIGLKNSLVDKAVTIEQIFVHGVDNDERLENLNNSILGDIND